jgi:hypothetical protein
VTTAARTAGSVTLADFPWQRLRRVQLRGGRQARFVLQGKDDRCVVPVRQAPDGLIERLQGLDGFDNSALIAGLAHPRAEAEFICWRAPRSR